MEKISWSDFEKIALRAGTVVEVEEFPEAVKAGSVFWGIILLLLGTFLLLANFEVISYSTAWQFWPVVVMVIGIKLIVDFVTKKREENSGG